MHRTIFIVRHGETVWNTQARFQGHLDSPLTETGLAQARSVGNLLKELVPSDSIAGFFASPIGRASKTAQIVAKEVQFDFERITFLDNLKELDFGRWQGMSRDEIRQEFPGEFEKREQDKWNFPCPDGESYAAMSIRVEKVLQALPSRGTVILVSHGMINRVIRGLLLKISSEAALQFNQTNNAVVKITDVSEEILTV